MTSSPLRAGATLEEELAYYKAQYEQLETDLADFQASSKELEEQLEKDVDAAEKSERKLKEQVEKLGFEVDEWKTKYNKSKAESNSAQNALQKEITTMRDSNRTLQLKLRDIEVANDDYERKARNTESSLEDIESKYNVTIERGVMLEEEMRQGEQEREGLRVETQRLRDELSDLKVEAEITQEKLRLAEETAERLRARKPSPLAVEHLRARSPSSEVSGVTPSSPSVSTPPASSAASDTQTPPSPPLSDAPAKDKPLPKTPTLAKRRSLIPDSATPRPGLYGPRQAPKHSRGPSMASNASTADSKAMKPPARRVSKLPTDSLPRSDSLYQIRGLIGRMQKIEERVHSARSKLPAAKDGTPRNSPRAASGLSSEVPSSVTVRRAKRTSGSLASSARSEQDSAPSFDGRKTIRDSHVKRLSFGLPSARVPAQAERPTSSHAERPASALADRPPSAAGTRTIERPPSSLGMERPASAAGSRSRYTERPPSAAAIERPPSAGSSSRPGSRSSHIASQFARPESRTSPSPARTPQPTLNFSASTNGPRPRSSVGGNYATIHGSRGHRPSSSVSGIRSLHGLYGSSQASEENDAAATPTSRRTTLDKSALPTPTALPRRQNGGAAVQKSLSSRKSTGFGDGEMRPPPSRRKMSDVGETY